CPVGSVVHFPGTSNPDSQENERMSDATEDVILANELKKSFKSRRGPVEAVRGVSITVQRGEIFGFLGPNVAGNTTTLCMLTTLLPIDSGTASVAGYDVARQPEQVRAH